MTEALYLEPAIRFEPGIHPIDESTAEHLLKRTLSGHADSHAWNTDVRRRISGYQPAMIAIDGLIPVGIDDDGKIDINQKAWIFNSMPGTPHQLNGSDEIFVLGADNVYGQDDGNGFLPFELRLATRIAVVGLAAKLAVNAHDKVVANRNKQAEPAIYDWEREEQREKREPAVYSRRMFLGLAAGSLTFAAFASNKIAASSPWQFSTHAAEGVFNATEEVSPDRLVDLNHTYDYMLGRTALLYTKLGDALFLASPKVREKGGAFVMGADHIFRADEIMHDYNVRQDCIRRHTELMLAKVKNDTKNFTGKWTAKERQQWVRDNQTTIQIYRVSQPDKKRFKKDPKKELERIVRLEDTIKSVAVIDAIEGLAA
jgi:hypothetical protein